MSNPAAKMGLRRPLGEPARTGRADHILRYDWFRIAMTAFAASFHLPSRTRPVA
jgi:hypothetical protein